jgi:hypothetical protein
MGGTLTFRNDNLTASATTTNILAGSIFEFLSANSIVNFYCVSSATGVSLQLMADNETIMDFTEIPNIGTTIDNSAHLLASVPVYAGTRLIAKYRETAGAATTDCLLKVETIDL